MLQPLAGGTPRGPRGTPREGLGRKGPASAQPRAAIPAPALPPRPQTGVGSASAATAEPMRSTLRPLGPTAKPLRMNRIVTDVAADPTKALPLPPSHPSARSTSPSVLSALTHAGGSARDVDEIRRAVEVRKKQQAQELMQRVLSHVVSPLTQDDLPQQIAAAGTKFVSDSMKIVREDNAKFRDNEALIAHLQSRLEWLLGELGLLEDRYVRALERREATEAELQRQSQQLQTLEVLLQLQQKSQEARRHDWHLERMQLQGDIDHLQEELAAAQERPQSRGAGQQLRPFSSRKRPDRRVDGPAWGRGLSVAEPSLADTDERSQLGESAFLHADCERRLQELREENAALNGKLQETIMKMMYGDNNVEVSPQLMDVKACWDALALAKTQHEQLAERYRKFQDDTATRLEEVRVHYEEELRLKLKDTSTAWREKADTVKELQAENKALLARYKAMEELVANTLTRLDRLQSVTLTGPSALALMDKIRNVEVAAMEDPVIRSRPSSCQTPLRSGGPSLRSLLSVEGEEGKLRDAVLEAVDSSPSIRNLLKPEFYSSLQAEIQRETVCAVARHTAKASLPTSPLLPRVRPPRRPSTADIHVPHVAEAEYRALTSAGSTLSESAVISTAGGDPSDAAAFPVLVTLPTEAFPWPTHLEVRPGSAAGAPAPNLLSSPTTAGSTPLGRSGRSRDAATQTAPLDPVLSPDHLTEEVLRLRLAHAQGEVGDLRQSVVQLAKQLAMFPMLLGPLTLQQEYEAKCQEVDQLHRVVEQLQRMVLGGPTDPSEGAEGVAGEAEATEQEEQEEEEASGVAEQTEGGGGGAGAVGEAEGPADDGGGIDRGCEAGGKEAGDGDGQGGAGAGAGGEDRGAAGAPEDDGGEDPAAASDPVGGAA
eukprot:EG_transcript_1900